MASPDPAVPAYATVSTGQVRVWQTGRGPDLIVLASPSLAAEVTAGRVAALRPGHRVTTLELPGLGGSAGSAADDLATVAARGAEAIAEVVDGPYDLVAVDLACAVAARLPPSPRRRASIFVGLDRARAWAATGRTAPPLTLRTDGTHLQALWSFLRDAHILAPDDPSQPATYGEPLPDDDALDRTFVAAAVEPEAFARLWNLCLAGLPGDGTGPERLSDLPAAPAPAPGSPEPRPVRTRPLPGGAIWHQSVETARGRMHLRRCGGEGPALLVIPTGGGSSSQFAPVVQGLARGRQAFSVDYVGNGLSAKPTGPITIASLAEDMAALIDALGLERLDVWGSHTGAVVGLELALRYPDKVGRLVMEGPVFVADDFQSDLLANYFPPIVPDRWGRHIPLVWNWRRDMFLFWPWYKVAREAARQLGLPSPRDLHDYAIGILESGRTYDGAYRAAFAYDTRARLPGLTRPALVTAGPNDMLVNALAETRALALANVTVRETPTTVWWPAPDPAQAAQTLAIYDAFLRG